MMTDFVHLHVHSEYSLLDGLSHLDDLVSRAKKLKMKALALTDHGVMHGIVKFHNLAKKEGIKPIIGVEGYLTTAELDERTPAAKKKTFHQQLLAKNNTGYKNLMRLVTFAHLEGYYYRPRFNFAALEKYHQGLIATTSCFQGIIPQLIDQDKEDKALEKCKYFLELFGDDFYIELQKHQGVPQLEKVNKKLIEFSRKLGIPLIATNDVHYVDPDDAKAQDALLAIQTKAVLSDKNRLSMIDSPDYYLKSGREMSQLFPSLPDALKNTLKVADKCNVDIPTGKWILPDYSLPKGFKDHQQYLRHLSDLGLKRRFTKVTKEIKKRLDYELDVICGKGFATYFLIVQDFVNWAKKNQIRVGPGRGSVAGSLVAYSLRITSIDPLAHLIPFERFMNPERPSPPDIDLDFADDRRDEVIEYIAEKYGRDRVAQIITFGTMEARGSVRDIGRVLGMPYSEPDKIAKLIPVGFSIEEALVNVPELQEFYKLKQYRQLLDLAKKVEGTARHASTHAAGLVIGDKPLTEYTPLQRESRNNRIMTQYDMYSLDCNVSEDAIGLLKIDLLGLRNLTTLQNAVDFVYRQTKKRIDISEIPLDDSGVFELLCKGETIGIFQLESAGMRHLARKLKPNRFSDITAMVALYRPGPMQLIDDFIAGKKNPDKIKYIHDDLKPVLEETYGIAVYQEQCLHIASIMGGYSLGGADILRRAIGKKKRSIMAKEKKKFITQAQEKNYSKEIAEKVWGYIERFTGYGFNKAHATAYAMIAYQTAYMKVHYPVEFMAALLTAESNNKDKISIVIEEAKRMKIKVLPPDVNESSVNFTIVADSKSPYKKSVRFGLSAIKNVGESAIKAILKIRKKKKFTSLTDFCRRVNQQKANKKVLESLIQVGAFDRFGRRSSMLVGLESIRQKATAIQKQANSAQTSLFTDKKSNSNLDPQDVLPDVEELPRQDLLSFEKQLLGFYLTEHPLADALKKIKDSASHQIGSLDKTIHLNKIITLGGTIKSVRRVFTKKNNNEMAFATLNDETGSIDLVIFPRLFEKTKDIWHNDQPILATGKVDFKDRLSLIVEKVKAPGHHAGLARFNPDLPAVYRIDLIIKQTAPKLILEEINQLLQANPGKDRVAISFTKNDKVLKRIELPFTIDFASINKKLTSILKPGYGIIEQSEPIS